jgi:hypothetical protein
MHASTREGGRGPHVKLSGLSGMMPTFCHQQTRLRWNLA